MCDSLRSATAPTSLPGVLLLLLKKFGIAFFGLRGLFYGQGGGIGGCQTTGVSFIAWFSIFRNNLSLLASANEPRQAGRSLDRVAPIASRSVTSGLARREGWNAGGSGRAP
jgi:hypothetical protein